MHRFEVLCPADERELVLAVTMMPTDQSWLTTVIGWFHDPESLLLAMGPWVLWGTLLIVLIESGILFPVLPGDSLLFTAGLLHERLGLHLPTLIALTFVAAFIGAQIGYWLGHRFGRRLFSDNARILKTEHLHQAERYFVKYGGRSLVIGRFIPFVRTFIPLAAGIARYPYGKVVIYNSLGALAWGVGITWAGSALGGIQFVHDNLSVIIILIVVVSVIPMIAEFAIQRVRQSRKGRAEAAEASAQVSDAVDADSEAADRRSGSVSSGPEAVDPKPEAFRRAGSIAIDEGDPTGTDRATES